MAGRGGRGADSGLDRALQGALKRNYHDWLESGLQPGDEPPVVALGPRPHWQYLIGQPMDRPGADHPIVDRFWEGIAERVPPLGHRLWGAGRVANAFVVDRVIQLVSLITDVGSAVWGLILRIGRRVVGFVQGRVDATGHAIIRSLTPSDDAAKTRRMKAQKDRQMAGTSTEAVAAGEGQPAGSTTAAAKDGSPSSASGGSNGATTVDSDDSPPDTGGTVPDEWKFRDKMTGVVMIHGIGPQLAGQTLLDWTGPIIRLIRDAAVADATGKTNAAPKLSPLDPELLGIDDPVYRANIDFSGETFPVVQVRVPPRLGDPEVPPSAEPRWIFTETWWATEVRPPTLRTMVGWLGEQGGVGRIVQGIQQNTFGKGPLHVVARISVLPFVSVVVSFALLLLILGLAIASLIPIASIRAAASLRLASTFLTDWFGGARTILRDPAQSANVRYRLVMTVKALRAYGCRRVVVVAHSGGTIVSLTTLTDPAYPRLNVDKLITIGEALNLGWRLEAVDPDAERPEPPKGDRMWGDLSTKKDSWIIWRDFFGTHDPAASGPPDPPGDGMRDKARFTTERVYNRMSVLGDHGGYWDNDEHFLIPLIREIDVPNGDRNASRFYSDEVESAVRARRKERLSFLRLWRRGTSALPILAILSAAILTQSGLVSTVGAITLDLLKNVPFSKELSGIGENLATAGNARLGDFRPFDAMYALGLLVLQGAFAFAILQALVPSRADTLWWNRKLPRIAVLAIDLALGPIVFGVILIVWFLRVAVPNGVLGPIGDLISQSSIIVTIATVAVVVSLGQVGRRLRLDLQAQPGEPGDSQPRGGTVFFSAAFLAAVLTLMCSALLGVLFIYTGSTLRPDSAEIRSFVVGAVVVLGLFTALQRIGEWRWDSWDLRERHFLRRDPMTRPPRGWALFVLTWLTVIAIASAILVALGTPPPSGDDPRLAWAIVIGLNIVAVAFLTIARDVVDNDVDVDGEGRFIGASGGGGRSALSAPPAAPPESRS